MEYYYQDVEKADGSWDSLLVNVVKQKPRRFYFETCHNYRFRLKCGDKTLLWGTIEDGFYGVNILRSYVDVEPKEMPVGVINSQTVEKASKLAGDEKEKFWVRYFTKSFAESDIPLFYEGLWKVDYIESEKSWNYGRQFPGMRDCLDSPQLEYLDWGSNGYWELTCFKKKPLENNSRVKWWRKKIKEGSLPPIVVINSKLLQTYVLIDGHSRLMASSLEGKFPDVICLQSICEFPRKEDERVRDSIVKSLFNRSPRKPISEETLNQMLVAAYDNRPIILDTDRTIAVMDNGEWEEEITEKLREIGAEDDIESLINRWGV